MARNPVSQVSSHPSGLAKLTDVDGVVRPVRIEPQHMGVRVGPSDKVDQLTAEVTVQLRSAGLHIVNHFGFGVVTDGGVRPR